MKSKEQQAKEYAAGIPHYQDRKQHAADDFIAGWNAAEQWRTDKENMPDNGFVLVLWENTHAPFWEVCKRSGCREVLETHTKDAMKASEMILDMDEVLSKVSRPLARKIEYSVDLIRKAERMALRLDPENGFYNTFSGGKDSQCLYHLVKMSGVKHMTHMNLTSVDPPEVIRFIKTQYPDVELIKPKMSIYDMAKRKHILPTRRFRWCCAEYKEMSGAGKVTLIGVRKEESARRAKREEVSVSIKGKRNEQTFDQWSEHEEQMVACVGGKDKILVSPIIYWTEKDVWEFLNANNIPHCKLYDEGYKRIGCICCPMSNRKSKLRDIERFPHVKRKWLETIQHLIDNGYMNRNFSDAETGFRWWISDKSLDKFYADEVLQQKIDFEQ